MRSPKLRSSQFLLLIKPSSVKGEKRNCNTRAILSIKWNIAETVEVGEL